MGEYLSIAVFLLMAFNISIWPPLIYFQNRQIVRQLNRLQVEWDLGPDDPDSGEDEPSEPSNVVAIGRRAA